MKVEAEINEMDVLKQMMVRYSYEAFARMIAVTVSQADEPKELSEAITRYLK